jgi:hypothetical protein
MQVGTSPMEKELTARAERDPKSSQEVSEDCKYMDKNEGRSVPSGVVGNV